MKELLLLGKIYTIKSLLIICLNIIITVKYTLSLFLIRLHFNVSNLERRSFERNRIQWQLIDSLTKIEARRSFVNQYFKLIAQCDTKLNLK